MSGASSINFVKENIFQSKDDTLVVNFTHEMEGKFLGIEHNEDVVNLNRGMGTCKVIKLGGLRVYTIFDRNFSEQNVSQSKLKFLLKKIKKYAINKGLNKVAFNEVNLSKYNLTKFYRIVDELFNGNKWGVNVHLNAKGDVREGYIVNSVRKINQLGKGRPIIECRVGKVRSAALVDTGAEVSVVDYDFIYDKGLHINVGDSIGILGVSGSSLEVVGSCDLRIGFRGQEIVNKVYVVKGGNLNTPFLFGCDFLRRNKMVIDFADESITLNGKFVRWLNPDGYVLSEVGEGSLIGNDEVYLEPGMGTKVEFSMRMPENAEYFAVVNVNEEVHKRGCVVPQWVMGGIFPVGHGGVEVDVINEGEGYARFSKGFKFCDIIFVSEEKVVREYAKKVSVLEKQEDGEDRSSVIREIVEGLEVKDDCDRLRKVLERNVDVFGKNELDIGKLKGYEHRIDLSDDVPVAMRPYRTPHSKVKEIDGEVERLLKAGVIEESVSAYSAPCLLVYKKSGKPRLVVDYRKLNAKIQPIRYPLPHLESTLQSLGGNSVFTTLDLLSGYHQIPLRQQDQHKTAFSTGRGLYQYRRVPFGMITSGAAMQYAMERVLGGLNGMICQTYIDDIIVYGKNVEEHDENLNVVLNRLRESGFKINLKKCNFRMREVECLGHVISGVGITPNPAKVKDIQEKKRPRTVKDVRSFMGMASYYRRFVKDFAQIAKPITELTKKDVRWKWSEECEVAYRRLIDEITNAPVLVYPDYSKTFYVTTDASGEGIGAMLSQVHGNRHRPIAFFSRGLVGAESRYHVYEQEGLAIKAALQKFKFYILGYKVVVRTDNQPILYLLKSKECQGRVGKYMASIMEFNPEFEYIKGRENHTADFLSRNVSSLSKVKGGLNLLNKRDLVQGQSRDVDIQDAKNGRFYGRDFREVNGLIYKVVGDRCKLFVPREFVNLFIDHFHGELGCHEGRLRTAERLKKYVFWKGLDGDVAKRVGGCHVCKISKPSHVGRTTVGRFPRITSSFERVHVDIVGPFKRSFRGCRYLLVGIDSFSHWSFIRALRRKDAESVSKGVEEELMMKGRTPGTVVCDLGKEFNSRVFKELCERYGTEVHFCAPYYHASNGLVERFNLQIENAMRCMLQEKGGSWDKYVNKIEKSLNTSIHGTVGFTPYEVVCGEVCPVDVVGVLNGGVMAGYKRDEMFEQVQKVRDRKVEDMLRRENKNKKYISFHVGDKVYVRIPERSGKLGPIYRGPVEIIKVYDSGYSYDIIDEDGVVYRVHVNNIRR